MSDSTQSTTINTTNPPVRKRLRLSPEFIKTDGAGPEATAPKDSTENKSDPSRQKGQLKKSSEPFDKLQKEKQKLAEEYFSGFEDKDQLNTAPQLTQMVQGAVLNQYLLNQQYMAGLAMQAAQMNPIQMGYIQPIETTFAQPDLSAHYEEPSHTHHKNPHKHHDDNKGLGGFGSDFLIDNFDEEEYSKNPEKYLESLPDEVVTAMESKFLEAQIDEIINDLEDEEDSNPEKFIEAMKDCACCHGFVNKCKALMCKNLGQCQCMVHSEMENEAVEHFIPECKDCKCCRGYVYTCVGLECKDKGACTCFIVIVE